MNDSVIFHETPELANPYILIGYRGWLNAGEVSTGCIDYMRRMLGARRFASIDPRNFYIWQVPGYDSAQIMRPHTIVEAGLVKSMDEPTNEFYFWQSGAGNDLILFSGHEPNLAWPEFTAAVLSVVRRYRARRIFTLGAVFDRVPHTRETSLYAVLSLPEMRREFHLFPLLNYSGPASFSTSLMHYAARENIEAVSIVARIPPYIHTFNEKIAYELLTRILAHTSLDIDLSDLKKTGDAVMELMNQDFRQNEEALAHLRKLEELYDTASLQGHGLREATINELMQEMMNAKKDGRKPH
jgi:proteasome assembly chaperone (PAC2) family protein